LKRSARIDLVTQVDGHADEPMLSNIIVPGIMVTLALTNAIHPTLKALDPRAPGYILNYLKQLLVIDQKQQHSKAGIARHTELLVRRDAFMNSLIKLASVNLSLNEIQHLGFDKIGESNVMLPIKLRAESREIDNRAGRCQS
jgi:hypothetical protein